MFDEQPDDPHGECRAEIERLKRSELTPQQRALVLEALRLLRDINEHCVGVNGMNNADLNLSIVEVRAQIDELLRLF